MLINNYPRQTMVKPQPAKQINFSGLLRVDPQTQVPLDSWFFRDITTLETATNEIKTEFPKGADILDFACSNGEETISLKALLANPKYKVIGYDTSESALKLANKGVYTVFSNWYDSFLLRQGKLSKSQEELRKKFYQIMAEIHPRLEDRGINNKVGYFDIKSGVPNFKEKFFRIAAEKENEIDIRRGNIWNVDRFRNTQPVAGIFFRNALYQMCGNDLNERLDQRKTVEVPKVDKAELIEEFVGKIHKKLSKNGVFVIGDHIKDHLFLADIETPDEEIIPFKCTPFFNPKNKKHIAAMNVGIYRKSPLVAALEKDGNFVPVGFSNTRLEFDGIKIKVPTIWKKIR